MKYQEMRFKMLISYILMVLALLSMTANGRQTPGEYWGERVLKDMGGEYLSLIKDAVLKDQSGENLELVKDLELTPNQLLVWSKHHKVVEEANKDQSGENLELVKDLELTPNQLLVWSKHHKVVEEVNKGQSGENLELVKDLVLTPNQLLVWSKHHKVVEEAKNDPSGENLELVKDLELTPNQLLVWSKHNKVVEDANKEQSGENLELVKDLELTPNQLLVWSKHHKVVEEANNDQSGENLELVKDLELTPNQLLVWSKHHKVVEEANNNQSGENLELVKDLELTPNQLLVWSKHHKVVEEANKDQSGENLELIKDLELTPNQLLVWRNHHKVVKDAKKMQLVNGEDHVELEKEGPKVDRATLHPFPDLMYVFFRPNQIRTGKIMPFYFGGAFATKYPHFIPKEKGEKIPFTINELPSILKYFGFEQDSKQAKAVDYTLRHCEAEPSPGVIKFCGTSLESMVENVWKSVGPNAKSIRPLSTSPLPKSTKKLQNYKVLGKPKEVPGSENMLGCHLMTYPYAVYFCHRPAGAVKVLEVKLEGEDGTKIDAIATCHLDTFKWDQDIDAFRFLGTEPGEPVCHVLPPDDLIWVPSNGVTSDVEANTSSHAM